MDALNTGYLRADGPRIVDATGQTVRLRGVGLGGWMNMENFITGFPFIESVMRRSLHDVLGQERYQHFFDELLGAFFNDDDAAFLAGLGVNCVRLPINYRHFEDDRKPFEILESGFTHLDRAVKACADHGIYTVIDLHALPGGQSASPHTDNPLHLGLFWEHPHFQDRVVNLWEHLADRYRDNPWVAGYNLINEPNDESGTVVGPYCRRLVSAVQAVDPHHLIFLDGNSFGREFDIFGEPMDGVVYATHDYAMPSFLWGGPYPGTTRGIDVDRAFLEDKFLARTEYQRRTGTPIWIGEFGAMFTGDPERDAQRQQMLRDQFDIYDEHGASWSTWTYKDIGLMGLVHIRPDSAYLTMVGDLLAKKARLGVDKAGSSDEPISDRLQPLIDLFDEEFQPRIEDAAQLRYHVRFILLAERLVEEYAELFRDLTTDQLIALAQSFTLSNCTTRNELATTLEKALR